MRGEDLMMEQCEILEILKQQVVEIIPSLPAELIISENSLKDLGANSLDRAEVIMLTLRALNLKIPLGTFGGTKNIGELVSRIHYEFNLATSSFDK